MIENKIKKLKEIRNKKEELKKEYIKIIENLTLEEIQEIKKKYKLKVDYKKKNIRCISKKRNFIGIETFKGTNVYGFGELFKGICSLKLKDKYNIQEGDYIKFDEKYINKLLEKEKELKFKGIVFAKNHIENGNKPMKVEGIINKNKIKISKQSLNLDYFLKNNVTNYLFGSSVFMCRKEIKKVNKNS